VKPPFSLFLALRYLKPKRTFVSTITLVSVLGVTLGITVLIVVISVMTGFDQELRRKVLGFDAHLLLHSDTFLDPWRPLQDQVDKTPGVVASAPFVQGPVIVEFNHHRLTPKIRGIDPERESKITNISNTIQSGAYDLDGDKAVIGRVLAESLGIAVGDKLIVYSPGNIGNIVEEIKKAEQDPGNKKTLAELREMVLPQELTVSGIFESGHYQFDSEFVLVPLHIGQELYGLGDALHGISIQTTDPYKVDAVKRTLAVELQPIIDKAVMEAAQASGKEQGGGPSTGLVYLRTWIDSNKQIFDAIRLERNVMFFLLLFIVVVAAFGIMNTLITVTVQKTREIGIMKALGATTGQIVWVFLSQGMIVGVFGNATGLAAGMALVQWRNEFKDWLANQLGIEIFPAGIYQFSAIPAEVIPRDVAIICASAFVICSVAALIPAYFAARLDPVKALRAD